MDNLIYDRVKEFADKKNLTISELEKKAGLGNGVIKKWNTSSPSVKNLQAVAKELKVSIMKLID